MRLLAETSDPCPDCKTKRVDVVIERKDSGKSDALVRCVECDRLVVLRGVTISIPENFGLAGIEGGEGVEVERLDGAIVDAVMNVAERVENDELVKRLKEAAKAFENFAKAGAEMKVDLDLGPKFRPPPRKSSPPPGQGRGGRTFFYRGGGQR
jgi:hypothetical protein